MWKCAALGLAAVSLLFASGAEATRMRKLGDAEMARFDFETGYAHLEAAMIGGGASQVPMIAQMHEFAMRASGKPGHVFYSDARAFVEGICATARDFGFDTPSFIWDVYNVEAEALGVPLVLFEDMAPALDNTEPFISSEKHLAALKAPDPARDGRMPMVAEVLLTSADT